MRRPGPVGRSRSARGSRARWIAELEATREGRHYAVREGERVFIDREDLGGALPGDRVEVELVPHPRGHERARVLKVLERRVHPLTGMVVRRHGQLEFRPYRSDTADHFLLEAPEGLSPGDQVAVLRMPAVRRQDGERVRVVERLGRADEPRWDSQMVALEAGLPLVFPDEVLDEAREAAVPPEGVPAGRVDLRDLLTVTIDPPDARDHDDALSLAHLDDGFELGIHIADVSQYVRTGTALDDEALERGNSIYLPDMVIPMLPQELSGDVCSLRPGVDRLALSVMVTLDRQGSPCRHRIVASVIRSDHKLSYEEAEKILQGEQPAAEELVALLKGLWKVTTHLKAGRRLEGSLELDVPETRVLLDPNGEPLEVYRSVHRDSHQLVEECMILANRTVGLEAANREYALLYRVHEAPLESRLAEFALVAGALGLKLPERRRRGEDWVRNISFRDAPEVKRKLMQTLLLRSLAKARYSPADLGHYGLGISRYAHFTSPIRRYPDLVNHRQVHRWLQSEPSGGEAGHEGYAEAGEHCTETEIKAMEAERLAIQMKCVRFMLPRVGEEFKAVVTGMIRSGFFVELLDFPVEGMVRFAGLHEDHYIWEPEKGQLRGRHTGATLHLGDDIVVTLVRADLESRQLEFLPSHPLGAGRAPKRPGRHAGRRR